MATTENTITAATAGRTFYKGRALQMMNPRGMAEALAAFFARHPLRK